MLKNKIKSFLGLNIITRILHQSLEIEWAHVYHDSIRDKPYLQNLSLNIGRWAGNYAFFYLLNRILFETKPKRILELGLGESSKLISVYIENILVNSEHLIFEHNLEWIENFNSRFKLSNGSKILNSELSYESINGYSVCSYKDFNSIVDGTFDLYIIDGPFGSSRFSRFDIVSQLDKLESKDDFIMIFDDTDRFGESETANYIIKYFKSKEITIFTASFVGNKSLTVIVTEKYRFVTSY